MTTHAFEIASPTHHIILKGLPELSLPVIELLERPPNLGFIVHILALKESR